MEFLPILQKMVELFIIIIIGYIISKAGVMNKQGKQMLSKLVLSVTMPCTILSSVINSSSLPTPSEILSILAVAFLSYVPLFLLGLLAPKILRIKGAKQGVTSFAILFGNVGFIGYPVTQAIYGDEALFYTCVFNMPFNIICYSLGVYMLKKHNDNEDGEVQKMNFSIKSILTPAFIASCIAIILALVNLKLPAVICEPVGLVGNVTTPAALIVIGVTLSEMKVVEMFNNVKAYLVSFFVIIISPVITYLIFAPFTSGLTLRIAVILAAMPVATSGTMLCVEHKCDEKFMAQVTFLTTLFTIFTIPLSAVLMEMF